METENKPNFPIGTDPRLSKLQADHDKYKPLMETLEAGGRLHWCEPWRHGYITHLRKEETQDVSRALTYFFGSAPRDGQWWLSDPQTLLWSVEFTHQTKVFPPPKYPWDWCGKTHLFNKWKDQVYAESVAQVEFASAYRVGDRVQFSQKGTLLTGILISIPSGKRAKRAKVLCDHDTWYVPISQITKVGV